MPNGLEDVSKFPDLVAELIRRDWTEEEVKGAIGNNLLRVFRAVEEVLLSEYLHNVMITGSNDYHKAKFYPFARPSPVKRLKLCTDRPTGMKK